MHKLGFAGLLSEEKQGCIISTFVSPKDASWDFDRFYNILASKGCIIYPGKLTKVDSFRIGTIGHIFPENIEYLLDCIADAVFDLGVQDCSPIEWEPSSGCVT
jgi:2-aminoethylphosphonate-pyruvate transaminase